MRKGDGQVEVNVTIGEGEGTGEEKGTMTCIRRGLM